MMSSVPILVYMSRRIYNHTYIMVITFELLMPIVQANLHKLFLQCDDPLIKYNCPVNSRQGVGYSSWNIWKLNVC